jgi:peptidoglycan hydrolase-like protein with peptidoglycan-binding domain
MSNLGSHGRWVRRQSTIILLDEPTAGLEPELEDSPYPSTTLPTLQLGSRGTAVAQLQARLATVGFSAGPSDGVFGPVTQGAVRAFQASRGLAADGVVGPRTWGALVASGGAPPPPAPAPGGDPDIERLGLAEPARSGAYAIKARHPWVRFTSGRRDLAGQARAMAGNVTKNRKWIIQTYASSPIIAACQRWVDQHPEARTGDDIARGLLSVFSGFPPGQLAGISRHLAGLAFDMQPVPSEQAAVSETVNRLPGKRRFLTREGGLIRWHVEFVQG